MSSSWPEYLVSVSHHVIKRFAATKARIATCQDPLNSTTTMICALPSMYFALRAKPLPSPSVTMSRCFICVEGWQQVKHGSSSGRLLEPVSQSCSLRLLMKFRLQTLRHLSTCPLLGRMCADSAPKWGIVPSLYPQPMYAPESYASPRKLSSSSNWKQFAVRGVKRQVKVPSSDLAGYQQHSEAVEVQGLFSEQIFRRSSSATLHTASCALHGV